MTVLASVGDVLELPFAVFDIDGITPRSGLVDADFTKTLLLENTLSGQPVTVIEVANGRYAASFTPNANGLWYVDAIADPVEEAFGCYVQVGPAPTDWNAGVAQNVWNEVLPNGGAADTAGDRLVRVTTATEEVQSALIAASLTAGAGATVALVPTNATQVDGFYDGMTVVVRGASGAVVRRITSYSQASGAFAVTPDLPFVPASGDSVYVLGILGEVAVAGNADVAIQLAEIHRLMGLDPQSPLCVTKSSQTAGTIRLEHTEIGDKIIVTRTA